MFFTHLYNFVKKRKVLRPFVVATQHNQVCKHSNTLCSHCYYKSKSCKGGQPLSDLGENNRRHDAVVRGYEGNYLGEWS